MESVIGGDPLVKLQETIRKMKREREMSLHYQSLATDSASPTVPRWGHLGLKSDILSNCIILLSMLMGYVIFHRSVPIIRAWLSQRDPPDVCDLLQLDLVFPSKPQQPGLTRTFQKQFLEN